MGASSDGGHTGKGGRRGIPLLMTVTGPASEAVMP